MLHRITLKFKDDNIERQFMEEKLSRPANGIYKLFLLFSFASFVYSFIFLALNKFQKTFLHAISDLSRIILYSILVLLIKKFKFIKKHGGTLIVLIPYIVLSEYYFYLKLPNAYLLRVLAYQALFIRALLTMNFIFLETIIFLSATHLYFILRFVSYFSSESTNSATQSQIIYALINSYIVMIVISYHLFKQKKRKFFHNYEKKLVTEDSKLTIDFLPEGVLVEKDGKIIHNNPELLKMLQIEKNANTTEEKEIKRVLSEKQGVRKDLKYKKDSSREREEEEKRELERDVWSLILEEEANMHERKDNMFTLNYSMRGDSEKVPPEPFIEMKGRNILFNNERANLILFHDVSAIVFKSNAECKYKEMLMVTITHELRTPVSGIMTVLHLLKDLTNSQGREYINIALSTAHLLLNLINDMMGCLRINIEKFNILDTIQNIFHIVKFQADQKGIQLLYEIRPNVSKIISDEKRFMQILLNLLSNALKFTRQGFIKVIASRFRINEEEYLKCKVQDTGVGIMQEDLSKLFKSYSMLDNTASFNRTGTGLGLYLCKNLTNILGGDITVSSKYGEGTTFKFWIKNEISKLRRANLSTAEFPLFKQAGQESWEPWTMRDSEIMDNCGKQSLPISSLSFLNDTTTNFNESHEIQRFTEISAPSFASLTTKVANVLVADDNEFNLFSIKTLLKQLKLKCDWCYNGEEAIELILERKRERIPQYDMVLMDFDMPILNGIQASFKLKCMMEEGELETFPIIGLTAHSEENLSHYSNHGMRSVLCKPIALEQLQKLFLKYPISHGLIK